MPLALPCLPLSLDESLVTPELWEKVRERYNEDGAVTLKGGKGSGFFGHSGRPGKKGGSAAQGGSIDKNVMFRPAVGDPWHPKAPIPKDTTRSINLVKADRLEGLPKDKEGIRGYWIDENNTLYSDDSTTSKGDWSGGFHTYSMAQIIYDRYEHDKIGELAVKVINKRDFENQEIEHWGLENGYIKVRSMEGIPGDREYSEPRASIFVFHANRASLRRIQKLIDNGLIPRAKEYEIISYDGETPHWGKIPAFDLMAATSIVPRERGQDGFILKEFILRSLKGGKGSGFFGHAGRPGKKGGSAAGSGNVSASTGDNQEVINGVARQQRDLPEKAMVEAQKIIGGGELSFMIEHAGDLIHRMSESATYEYGGYDYVKEKINKLSSALRQTNLYKTVREQRDDRCSVMEKKGIENFDELFDGALRKYVAEHRKLKPVNRVQALANNIAIDVGSQDFNWARSHLFDLKEIFDKGEENWINESHTVGVSLKSKTANVLHWKTLVKEYRKKYNKSKESAMVYAEIEVFGKKAVLTEKGWECDQADLVKVLNLELNQPLEMYEPNPAAAFAERAAKLMGGKVISVISPPDNDGKEIVY
jgi:hypothetical protein